MCKVSGDQAALCCALKLDQDMSRHRQHAWLKLWCSGSIAYVACRFIQWAAALHGEISAVTCMVSMVDPEPGLHAVKAVGLEPCSRVHIEGFHVAGDLQNGTQTENHMAC